MSDMRTSVEDDRRLRTGPTEAASRTSYDGRTGTCLAEGVLMHATFRISLVAAAAALALAAGCDRNAGDRSVGQKLDNAIDRTQHKLAEAGDKTQQKLA